MLEKARQRLLRDLSTRVEDQGIIQAMGRVPREQFVPAELAHEAYEDVPLPMGEGQTISQPTMVAIMVSALELRRSDKVLEIGTGSGYQTAILSILARDVVSVERIFSLASAARERLSALGYNNVTVHDAEEELGYLPEAPYDAIVVSAGAPRLPRKLIMEQLANRGRLVVPVGSLEAQELMKAVRTPEGFSVKSLGGCRFVPLIGADAWSEAESDLEA
ncbi:MAG: protein-L-isoaspartate O-methyltransferase [SAR202 cluster bacterium Casp-Chloro-G4]|nr:protein-L-isoaspartate(D-aspartate) O-methyltransferase [Chloroflexota bacterium]MDA1228037.1 protein-L-isoaspartate(D-aspartate) O-methyltransferase [Chloroflexota bacterium]PKB61659.1 MAG: protein-L-isoaspartate O-methyltransferase [SAR202 cluster bacterium Casp-Chloro-G4]